MARRAMALEAANRAPRSRRFAHFLWDWAKVCTLAFALFLVVRAVGVEAYKIPSGSMERTILVGDFLLVNKIGYGAPLPFGTRRLPRFLAPARGDVVVFTWPRDPGKNLVKRLVGVAGDTLAMRGGTLYVNGTARPEGYVEHTEPESDPSFADFRWQEHFAVRTAAAAPVPAVRPDVVTQVPAAATHPSRDNWGPITVPAGHYFVLGDNRDNSLDSRYWGFVPDSMVIGRPLFVYYSYAPDSTQPLAWATRVRWRRLGTRVR